MGLSGKLALEQQEGDKHTSDFYVLDFPVLYQKRESI